MAKKPPPFAKKDEKDGKKGKGKGKHTTAFHGSNHLPKGKK